LMFLRRERAAGESEAKCLPDRWERIIISLGASCPAAEDFYFPLRGSGAMGHGTRNAPRWWPQRPWCRCFLEVAMAGGLRSTLESIRARDPAARSLVEIFFLYPGLRALAFHRIAHSFWQMGLTFLARFVSEVGR